MKQLYSTIVFCFLLLSGQSLVAQSTGDYRSAGSGNWNALAWERYNGTAWAGGAAAPDTAAGQINILAGHSVTVSAPATADQLVVDAGGTLVIEANSGLALANGAGEDLVISGTVLIIDGSLADRGSTFVATGGHLIFFDAFSSSVGGMITNNGTIDWNGGDIFCSADTMMINNSVFNIRSNQIMRFSSSSAGSEFINNGTINKESSDTTEFILGDVFTNTGVINLHAGTLITRNIFTNTGNLVFNSGYFIFEHTFIHNGGNITGIGHFTNSSRLDLNINQAFPAALEFTMHPGSTVDGPGDLTLNQDFTITGSILGPGILVVHGNTVWNSNTLGRRFMVEGGRTLTLATPSSKSCASLITNNGTIEWQDGTIFCSADTVIVNNSLFTIRGNNSMRFSSSSAGSEFINNGTINKESNDTTEFMLGDAFTNGLTGIMKGSGTILMNYPVFINNGMLAPGHSPGLLSFNSAQPLSDNSTLQIEMQDGSGAGTGHDQLTRNSDLILAGTLTVTESTTVPTGTYTIIRVTTGTVSGGFDQVNLPIGYSLVINTDNVQLVKHLVVTPVKLVAFKAAPQNHQVLLQWITENEVNNQYFDVERSHNGADFIAIGRVKASTATTYRKEYPFTDQLPVTGINYYRLKQVDIDGRFEYSPIVTAVMDQQQDFIVLHPTIVKDMLHIRLSTDKTVLISILDPGGRQVIHQQAKRQSLLLIPVQHLPAGIYYLQATDGVRKTVLPFLKQ
ncbi:hypothetical protein HB364_22340 [Pseudoflavitalea sp. X16]|uniref:hypothetical protein n=1 Tax=Paraflavitalea devenefica TaxID=2716334 RepID=UPI00141EBF3D|nr:hypothetical protein [Paraflavitalea devenefica]NII27839.1 hypothetical protein [Paraflavitalea devenefica]